MEILNELNDTLVKLGMKKSIGIDEASLKEKVSREKAWDFEDVLKAKRIEVFPKTTVEEFCEQHPRSRYILDMDEHWSACVDGCIYDTWDCGNKKVNFAYEITTEPYMPPDIKKQVFKYCCTSERISDIETRIRIYDGNGAFVERKIPTELTKGYVLCLQHSNYQHIDLDRGKENEG